MLDKNNCEKTGWVNDYEMINGDIIKNINSLDFKDWKNVKNIIPYNKNLLEIDINGKAILKSDENIQKDQIKKIQNQMLNQFKPLIDAMTFQEISKSKGSNQANLIFTDNDIKNWGNYIGEIVKGNIEATMPNIPSAYQNLIS
jgi:hypothetical protein